MITPPSQAKSKSKKGKEQFLCPICDDGITDATDGKPGDDSIFCEGGCSAWLHRRCAGLSKSAFTAVSKSDKPFKCPQCKLQELESEVSSLKGLVTNLSSHLTMVTDELTELKACKANPKGLEPNSELHPNLASSTSGSDTNRTNFKPKSMSENTRNRKMNVRD